MSKISDLPPANALDGSETIPLVQDGDTKRGNVGEYIQSLAQPYVDEAQAAAANLSGILPSFEEVLPVDYPNVYDPNIATSLDGQYAGNSGTTLSASPKWHFSGFVPGTPLQAYEIDLRLNVSGWVVKRPANIQQIHCFTETAIGTFHSYAPAVFSEGDRKVTFTMPAGASYFAWNSYQGGYEPTADQFAAMRAATFVYDATEGTTDLFASYKDGSERQPILEKFTESPVTLIRDGTDIYVRQRYDADFDNVRYLSIAMEVTDTDTGAIAPGFAVIVPKGTSDADVPMLVNGPSNVLPYSERQRGRGGDTAAPENLNNTFIGGGHGFPEPRFIEVVGHGFDLTKVGDVGIDGASKSWELVDILDEDNLIICPLNEGTETAWVFDSTLTGTTITFGDIGAVAFTDSGPYEINDILQNHNVLVRVGEQYVFGDDIVHGKRAQINESYGIPNPADWLTQLVAEKGTATPRKLSDPANATHVELEISFQFDRFGGKLTFFDHYVKQGYSRYGNSYWSGQQWLSLFRRVGSGDRQNLFIPDLTGLAGGYDFTAIADIEDNVANVDIPVSLCQDPDNPASHMAQIIKDSLGAPKYAFASGYSRRFGIGKPEVRKTLINRVANHSGSNKFYHVGVDAKAGANAAAGENWLAVCWDQFYPMTDNPEYTVNCLFEYPDGSIEWIIDIHATLDAVWITLPGVDNGLPATVIDSTNFTLHSQATGEKGLRVSTTGGRGRAVVVIGQSVCE